QQAVYDRYDPKASMTILDRCLQPVAKNSPIAGDPITSGNGQLAALALEIVRCPSDLGDPLLPDLSTYGVKTGSGIRGVKTNYDFSVEYWQWHCNAWKKTPTLERRMFGENSDARIGQVADGMSKTIAFGETTLEAANGRTAAWAYRGWVQVGIDPAQGINVWASSWTNPPNVGKTVAPTIGQVGSWGWPGSLHSGGAFFAFGDGAVKFLTEDTGITVLEHLAKMADGGVDSGT
ncbi:MAG: DUF1559 domain-containing protein, partial [Planctomycetales bacterium]|nr:DUF1559 domain-containing protein [Planctomycetales bacterium]